VIVPREFAEAGVDQSEATQKDHIQICKVESREDFVYLTLRAYIQERLAAVPNNEV
jgi:hypothetical protein